jgi:hypothetical protein
MADQPAHRLSRPEQTFDVVMAVPIAAEAVMLPLKRPAPGPNIETEDASHEHSSARPDPHTTIETSSGLAPPFISKLTNCGHAE